MNTKLIVGESVKCRLNELLWCSLYSSVNTSVKNSVWSLVRNSVSRNSINVSMIWTVTI